MHVRLAEHLAQLRDDREDVVAPPAAHIARVQLRRRRGDGIVELVRELRGAHGDVAVLDEELDLRILERHDGLGREARLREHIAERVGLLHRSMPITQAGKPVPALCGVSGKSNLILVLRPQVSKRPCIFVLLASDAEAE